MRIKKNNNKEYIFDPVRKKYVRLTPEENVRQLFIHILIHQHFYPTSLLSVEKRIKLNNLSKRYDIVVYKNQNPWMIVECKHEKEAINQITLQQIIAYNFSLKVDFLVLFNGNELWCFDVKKDRWGNTLPEYNP